MKGNSSVGCAFLSLANDTYSNTHRTLITIIILYSISNFYAAFSSPFPSVKM